MSSIREAYEKHVANGGGLVPVPDGPALECFEATRMAEALEREANRAEVLGLPKVQITMTLDDASRLAAFMRRAAVAGA
jgi:hypothetical protein